MDFRILGPLEVAGPHGEMLDLGRPKQRALLGALIVEANRVVSLDRLVETLWADKPPARAATSLQAYVSNLRRLLEPDRARGEGPSVLLTRAPGYLLHADPDRIDARRFETLVAQGRRQVDQGDPERSHASFDAALALWRGPVLADIALGPEAVAETTRLEALRLAATEGRAEAGLALGRHVPLVAELEGLVAQWPLREHLRALLMLALYRSGRQAEALDVFRDVRATLAQSLGLEPGPDLARLERDILDHAPHLQLRPPASEVTPVDVGVARTPHAADAGDDDVHLVGRHAQLRRWDAALAAITDGRGAAVLVDGEAGIGKTRLVEEFARRAAAAGCAVAWGRCPEVPGTPPFWPWVQVVRSVIEAHPADQVRAALGARAGDLAQVVPALAEIVGPVPASDAADATIARWHLYEAFQSLLTGLSRRRPLLVVIDDLEWADPASLELLGLLANSLAGTRVGLVATCRRQEVGNAPGLADLLAALPRLPHVEPMPLAGLAVDEVAALLADTLGNEPVAEFADAVHGRTEGNPFFVVELARMMRSEERVYGPQVLPRGAPDRVVDVLGRRLARLPEGTNALLQLASVHGREFELRVVGQAAGLQPDQALELVEAAMAAGLVTVTDPPAGRFRFCHALVRDALYEHSRTVRRARLHARLADAIASVHGEVDDHAATLAHHLVEAAQVLGPERGYAACMRAASVAVARGAHEDAERHLRSAVRMATAIAPDTARTEAELEAVLQLASLVSATAGWTGPGVGDLWARARALCEPAAASHQLLVGLWGTWVFAIMRGDTGTGVAVADELVRLADRTDDPAAVLIAATAAGYSEGLHVGRLGGLDERLQRGLTAAATVDDDWLVERFTLHPAVLATCIGAWSLCLRGDPAAGRARADDAVSWARRLDAPLTLSAVLVHAAVVGVFVEDPAYTRRLAEEAIARTASAGFGHYHAFAQVLHGWAVADTDDAAAGVREIEAGLAAIEGAGWVLQRPLFLGLLGQARWRNDDLDGALDATDQALQACEDGDERFWEAELHRLRGGLLLASRPDPQGDADPLAV